jgi:hypothetical protein
MSFAIVRGWNGRRHEVAFGADPITVDVMSRENIIRITVAMAH